MAKELRLDILIFTVYFLLQNFYRMILIFAALVFVQCIPKAQATTIETVAYEAMKNVLMAKGDSEDYANCVIKVWKFQGVTNDFTDLSNYMDLDKMAQKLESKMKFATFICKNVPFIIISFMMMVVLILCCCCFCICRSSKQQISRMPTTIHLNIPLSSNGRNIPYDKVDRVDNV